MSTIDNKFTSDELTHNIQVENCEALDGIHKRVKARKARHKRSKVSAIEMYTDEMTDSLISYVGADTQAHTTALRMLVHARKHGGLENDLVNPLLEDLNSKAQQITISSKKALALRRITDIANWFAHFNGGIVRCGKLMSTDKSLLKCEETFKQAKKTPVFNFSKKRSKDLEDKKPVPATQALSNRVSSVVKRVGSELKSGSLDNSRPAFTALQLELINKFFVENDLSIFSEEVKDKIIRANRTDNIQLELE